MMRYFKYIILSIVVALVLTSCSSTDYKGDPVGQVVNIDSIIDIQQKENLAEVYSNHGNIINTKGFPFIVRANAVNKHLNNWLLIDIRSKDSYESGHINGAYNVAKEDVIDFLLTKQSPAAYDKVVIICYSGQLASYVTGVLRYAGFNNVYVMMHGMASWNAQFSGILKNNFATAYRGMVEGSMETEKKEGHHKEEITTDFDKLPNKNGVVLIENIVDRAKELLKKPRKDFLLKADEVFPALKSDASKYYVVNYQNEKAYNAGHIKGAHLFTSRKDLSLANRLTDLPKDKPVLVYCKTGHTGSQTAAYLNMLGYNAYNLMFGRNSFEYDVFTGDLSDISGDFPVVEGVKRTNNKIVASASSNSNKAKKTAKPIVKRKKKAVSGGCG